MKLFVHDTPKFHIESGTLAGLQGEGVERALKRVNIPVDLAQAPIARALYEASQTPNVCVAPVALLADARATYAWIAPLGRIEIKLYALHAMAVTLPSLEALRALNLRVGVVTNDLPDHYLRQFAYVRRDPAERPILNLRKLALGRIDLWATDADTLEDVTRNLGERLDIDTVLALETFEVGLACHPQTTPSILAALRSGLVKVAWTKAGGP